MPSKNKKPVRLTRREAQRLCRLAAEDLFNALHPSSAFCCNSIHRATKNHQKAEELKRALFEVFEPSCQYDPSTVIWLRPKGFNRMGPSERLASEECSREARCIALLLLPEFI